MEAVIYCISATKAINETSDKQKYAIEEQAQYFIDTEFNKESYDYAISKIVEWSQEFSIKQGWSIEDEEGMSWFLGLFNKAYEIRLGNNHIPFNKIFKDSFIKHFFQL